MKIINDIESWYFWLGKYFFFSIPLKVLKDDICSFINFILIITYWFKNNTKKTFMPIWFI